MIRVTFVAETFKSRQLTRKGPLTFRISVVGPERIGPSTGRKLHGSESFRGNKHDQNYFGKCGAGFQLTPAFRAR